MVQWGCIADDVTGATDLATNLVGQGLRTVVLFGPPEEDGTERPPAGARGPGAPGALDGLGDVDAVVIALKSRTAPVDRAVRQSLAAARLLEAVGCDRFYVKYCSTFDSTPAGNIGPVVDALMEHLGETVTIVVPSFPDAGRTVYLGHLFVGDDLLDESPMRDHPLTPMRDSSLPRLLAPQTSSEVAQITLPTVRSGPQALASALESLRTPGGRVAAVLDAITTDDLRTIMEGSRALRIVTGGSGLAQGLAPLENARARDITVRPGLRAVLCGSASQRTREQVAHARDRLPWRKLDPQVLRTAFDRAVADIVRWARELWASDESATPLVYSADSLADVVHDAPGRDAESSAELVERAIAAIARGFVDAGVTQLIVAGGESSGGVLAGLGVTRLRVGPEISAGVTWGAALTRGGALLNVALKSGNFGPVDMFTTAWRELGRTSGQEGKVSAK
ncbi:HPr kinase [Streptomyces sulfonofaciens]|uniref:3-oxo-tetronate kinase n=1 Tax=Streptomyces sulfonofaciens TaxID=68272 RepID=A0A919KUP2_9ACTN|nr:3-oxo-tetronate kinase [Streptomyces sulfonofaciens]GHH72491.1 HPr kinase [Streptomyces sulfonofaciens]